MQPTTAQLEEAVVTSKEIDRLQTRLAILLTGGNVNPLKTPARKVKRTPVTPVANGAVSELSASAAKRPIKKNLSVEARLRISAAATKRWAARKAAGKNRL